MLDVILWLEICEIGTAFCCWQLSWQLSSSLRVSWRHKLEESTTVYDL